MNKLQKLLAITNGDKVDGLIQLDPISDESGLGKVYFYRDNDTLYIGFSPTMDKFGDWVRNFYFKKIGLSILGTSYIAHAGFALELMTFLPKILGVIALQNTQKIEVSGYSQGASHAIILGLYLSKRECNVTTFGGPRCLGIFSAIEASKHLRLTRIVHNQDAVPHLPLSIMLFAHVGKAMKIGKKGFLDIKDHYFDNYMNELE